MLSRVKLDQVKASQHTQILLPSIIGCCLLLFSCFGQNTYGKTSDQKKYVFWELISPELQTIYLENPSVDPRVLSFLDGTPPVNQKDFGTKLINGSAMLMPLNYFVFSKFIRNSTLPAAEVGALCHQMVNKDPGYVISHFNFEKEKSKTPYLFMVYGYFIGQAYNSSSSINIDQSYRTFIRELQVKLNDHPDNTRKTLDQFLEVVTVFQDNRSSNISPLNLNYGNTSLQDFISRNKTNISSTTPSTEPLVKNTQAVATPVEEKIYTVVNEPPMPIGGDLALYKYIDNTITYPSVAIKNNTQGKVTIMFVVEPDGSLTNFKVIKGIGDGCDEEALRVLQSAPRWIPGKLNGKIVRTYVTRPIAFKIRE